MDFPGSSVGKESAYNAGVPSSIPGLGRSPGKGIGYPFQCKETEEYNRMGKTRDLFKKTTDTKEIFHAKIGIIKDRNGMDLTEAEDIKKRREEYTEELHEKYLNDLDKHNGVITHLEQDILE